MTPEMIEQWAREAGADWFGDLNASFVPKLCALAFAAGAEAMRRDAATYLQDANWYVYDDPGGAYADAIRALPLPKK